MQRPKPIAGLRNFVHRRRPVIDEVVREPTAGGVIFRHHEPSGMEHRVAGKPEKIEILLIQDSKGRWTIPKGHIEENESPREAAAREIAEETGLKTMQVLDWLGKINFRYRRNNSLVLMTTDIFLVKATGDSSEVEPEKWMTGLAWMSATDALDKIEYEDIGKLILLGLKKIREQEL